MDNAKETNTIKFPLFIQNQDKYEMSDCAGMLNHLEKMDKNRLKPEDSKRILSRLDSQLNYSMLM